MEHQRVFLAFACLAALTSFGAGCRDSKSGNDSTGGGDGGGRTDGSASSAGGGAPNPTGAGAPSLGGNAGAGAPGLGGSAGAGAPGLGGRASGGVPDQGGSASAPGLGGEPGAGTASQGGDPSAGTPSQGGDPSAGTPSRGGERAAGAPSAGSPDQGSKSGQGGESSGGTPEQGGNGGTPMVLVELRGACPVDERIGLFTVQTDEEMPIASFDGGVKDGLDPNRIPEVMASDGDCVLLRPPRYVCDPPCSSGSTCGPGGQCQLMARGQSVGTILVEGLAPPYAELELEPQGPGNVYYQSLSLPPVPPGGLVNLATTAGFLGAVSLRGVGVDPLVMVSEAILLEEGEASSLRWEPPKTSTQTRARLSLSVDQHGVSPARLVCDFADTGAIYVPAAMVDALLEAGITGFPSAALARHTVDSATVAAGCVELEVLSFWPIAVSVSGYTPCVGQGDCPDGQTCNTTLQFCY
ncbi:MAG: hypothetical protein JW751_01630 [Polyangiaceae bacterium]|nr:hypothetical protein [Polyangiaceae bacterium]